MAMHTDPIPPRRRFIRTTTGALILGAVPLASCSLGSETPDSAIAAWTPSESDQDPRKLALSFAILAPNPHNRQPWIVDLSEPNQVSLAIDTDRLLPDTDPFGRQILIGTGAMLGLLEMAAARFGYETRTTLFENQPFGQAIDSRTIARIEFKKMTSAPVVDPLFDQITGRRTVRDSYDPSRKPDVSFTNELKTLSNGAIALGITDAQGPTGQNLIELAKHAWLIELSTPRTIMESMKLLRVGSAEINQHRDGITINEPMLVVLNKLGMLDRSEPPKADSMAFRAQVEDFNTAIDSTPAFFWLTSRTNSRITQLQVGQQYVAAQLLAAKFGLVMHPISQGLQEYQEMAPTYKQVHDILAQAGSTVQMLCRIGYLPADASLPGPSPRRGLAAHIRA